MGQLRKRVGLVHNLRQLPAAEEVLDRGRDALGIDQAAGRHVIDFFEAHPLLHGSPQPEDRPPFRRKAGSCSAPCEAAGSRIEAR